MRHFLAICTVALMSSGLAQNDIPGYQFITTTDSTGIYLSQSTSTWFDANLQAQDLGGHLLTLSSIEENELLNGYDGWIGLYQPSGVLDPDSGWTWVTGEPLLFEIPWSLNEPNDIGRRRLLGAPGNVVMERPRLQYSLSTFLRDACHFGMHRRRRVQLRSNRNFRRWFLY